MPLIRAVISFVFVFLEGIAQVKVPNAESEKGERKGGKSGLVGWLVYYCR